MNDHSDNKISFILGSEIKTLSFQDGGYSPTTTLLQYLRTLADRKGTKEGCAEGDCGACTVVLAEPDVSGKISYKTVDSCLVFLPMIHGKQVITVEDLSGSQDTLHPVQAAMVKNFGAQCGYCTPGIVMSLFGLYKQTNKPDRTVIDDSLTGNLCRCTGYRPIVESAAEACVFHTIDGFTENEKNVVKKINTIPKSSLTLKTITQNYFRPQTISEALRYMAEHKTVTVISGATDIALRVTKRHERIESVLDLSAISDLREIEEEPDRVILGAGASLNEIRLRIKDSHPAFYDILSLFGSPQIRNLATLGGNLGSASPIGDTLPLLFAYHAKIYLESIHGRRKVDIDAFITGYRQTVRLPEELITAVKIPKTGPGVFIWSYKVSKRKDLDISTVSAGFRLELNRDKTVKDILLAYGGMAERTKRAQKTEQFLSGKPWTRDSVESAMPLIDLEFRPISDARSGERFRRSAAKNLLMKFWHEHS